MFYGLREDYDFPLRGKVYCSIQSNYRQTLFVGEINFQSQISMKETDLWEWKQKISHYRYRFSIEIQLLSITDTDFGLKRIDSVPSDTKLLLTKNYSEIIIFGKITNLTRNSLKKSFFPGDFKTTKCLKNYEK